jgi:chondroitin AC lyase
MPGFIRYLAWTLVCAMVLARPAASRGEDDFERLKRQTREFGWPTLNPDRPLEKAPRLWEAQLGRDGSWKDVDYHDQTRNFWKTSAHLKRTLAMATLYAQEKEAGRNDPALKAATLSAAHFWIIHDFQNPNWWHNRIAVPGDMATILLMMGDEMPAADRIAGLKIAARATLSMTGQNRVWMAGIVFRRALVQDDAVLARQAREVLLDELTVTQAEGLQADESFHMHGPQQQMGNYGLSFATDLVAWARIWQGTAMAMPAEKVGLLRGFLLGEAVLTVNGTMDISAIGRQLFPNSARQKGLKVLGLLDTMAAADPRHAREYLTAARQDSQPVGSGLAAAPGGVINWNFFRSDTMVHRRPGFYASVKLCSRRVIGGEDTNSENLRGRYLADGATFLYETSREYSDIFPVWDWRRVPGITCMTTGTTLAPERGMETDFAGGVSDGTYGAEGLDYRRDGVSGRKGWFFLDGGVVCLGAGISGNAVRTSVDQRLAEGKTITSAGSLGPGVLLIKGVTWVLHGNEGYVFAQPGDVWAGTRKQTGSWRNVYASGSPARISKRVFSIWLDDVAQPASYAYTLIPGATAKKLQAWVANPPVEILSNTPEAQAVRDRAAGITEALFYAAGRITAAGLSISADAPCAVILRGGSIAVADPAQKENAVSLTINGKALSVTLPQGEMAGSTVRVAGGFAEASSLTSR